MNTENIYAPTSLPTKIQESQPNVAKFFSKIAILLGAVLTLGWMVVFFFLQKPVEDIPEIIFILKIIFLPFGTALWLFFVVPFCFILKKLFMSEDRTETQPLSLLQKNTIRTLTIVTGGVVLLSLATTLLGALSFVSEMISVLPLITLTIIAVFFLCVALVFWLLVSIWNHQRWTIPIALFTTTGFLLTFGLQLLHQLNPPLLNPADLLVSTGLIVLFALSTLTLLKTQKYFTGPPRRLWLQIPLLVVLTISVSNYFAHQLYWDDFSIEDADLVLPTRAIVPDEDNAYYFLPAEESLSSEEITSVKLATDYNRSLADEDFSLSKAKTAVAGSDSLVEDVIEASTKPAYQCPLNVNDYSFDAPFCPLNIQRDSAILAILHSRIATLEGDYVKALDLSLATMQLGKTMGGPGHTLIEYLVAQAIQNIGLEGIQFLLANTNELPNDLLVELKESLNQYEQTSGPVIDVYKSEYMSMKHYFLTDPTADLGISKLTENIDARKASYKYLPHQTVNQYANFTRKQITLAEAGCETDTEDIKRDIDYVISLLTVETETGWKLVAPNRLGNTLLTVIYTSFNDIHEKPCQFNTELASLQDKINEKLGEQK